MATVARRIFSVSPLSAVEGAVLVVTGGGAILGAVAVRPAADAAWWLWLTWWAFLLAGTFLVLRVAFGVLNWLSREFQYRWGTGPFRFQSPIVRRVPRVVSRDRPLGKLDHEQAVEITPIA